MRALLQIGHDLAAALDAACNGRPKALHRLRPAVPTPDQIEAAEIDRRAAEVRDCLPRMATRDEASRADAVTRQIEKMGWADAPAPDPLPAPLPREPQPYHPVTRPLSFRQGGYNR